MRGRAIKCTCIAATLLGTLGAVPAFADQTNAQPITQVLYNGTSDYTFFIGTGSWTATGCSAYYAQVLPNLLGKDKLIAIALEAYALGKQVQFQGTCDSQAGYFDVTYITVSG